MHQIPTLKTKKIIELDLSSYATKSDLENATGVNKSKFAKKTDLASLKSDFDDVDIDQLQIALVEISKLCNVVKMKLWKRMCMMNWLKKLMVFGLMVLVI